LLQPAIASKAATPTTINLRFERMTLPGMWMLGWLLGLLWP
jgi:hypothetical protein